ncbi:DUF4145 domain-containing protein [Polaromonas sp. YR568]|uniref:DUF4145 domain-containing protein n=1 Tax=Polaromonas sp. YR568 TaxID=1855301 RepID=UPI00398BD6F4
MAEVNGSGNIVARCPDCNGAVSTFEWKRERTEEWGAINAGRVPTSAYRQYRLFRCAGCGRGAIGNVGFNSVSHYPGMDQILYDFYPESGERMVLPAQVPKGIAAEFQEAEKCLENKCYRAAAGLFRSVLDKTLRANGYKSEGNLKSQIDAAAADGVITASRKRRAHEEIRVLGNDVLHDEWISLNAEDVELAHLYSQRLLEDFYDDRTSVEALLTDAGRKFQTTAQKAAST